MKNNGRCGHPPFSSSDRVRLTPRYVAAITKRRKYHLNWNEREGVVTQCNDYDALVTWDGRRSPDSVPVGALELAPSQSGTPRHHHAPAFTRL